MAHRVNVVGAENLMRAAKRHQTQVIHLSIDLVFAGREARRLQSKPTHPIQSPSTVPRWSNRNKSWLDYCRDACILRISLPMGISFNGHAGAIDWIASRFKANKPATLYFDEVRTPQYTDCLNVLFEHLLSPSAGGTLSRRRAAETESVPDRADRECSRRIRSNAAARLSANRSRPDATAGRQCHTRFIEADVGFGF